MPNISKDKPHRRGGQPGNQSDFGRQDNLVAAQVAALGETARELLATFPGGAARRAPSLVEAEDVWHRFERLTRKYWWLSTAWSEYMAGERPPFPGWETLGE